MSRTRVYVPRETAAVSVGADDVAIAIARCSKAAGADIELIRNGSWGASWLEPLVEVDVDGERIAYGNVEAADVESLFERGFLKGGKHARWLGPTAEIPYLSKQERWTFSRAGRINPLSLADFRASSGFAALEAALTMSCDAIIDAITASGLRGRGGAGFPTGIKWRAVLEAEAGQKYIVCNADEGDS
ncbi:MAG: formate dehydrogenase, partial [Halioglobus sp.]|nr:formate dehydrogenase [Halioglobus sp.]